MRWSGPSILCLLSIIAAAVPVSLSDETCAARQGSAVAMLQTVAGKAEQAAATEKLCQCEFKAECTCAAVKTFMEPIDSSRCMRQCNYGNSCASMQRKCKNLAIKCNGARMEWDCAANNLLQATSQEAEKTGRSKARGKAAKAGGGHGSDPEPQKEKAKEEKEAGSDEKEKEEDAGNDEKEKEEDAGSDEKEKEQAGASGEKDATGGSEEEEEETADDARSAAHASSAASEGGAVIAPFGKEDTARELQKHAAKTQDTLVDAIENSMVSEMKRAIFRSLTRLRAASIKEFDTIARLETQAFDEYNDKHHYRAENPLSYVGTDEGEVSSDKYAGFHG